MVWARGLSKAAAAVSTVVLATAFSLLAVASGAQASPLPTVPACAGNGTATATIPYGTQWYDTGATPDTGLRIITQGWAVPSDAQVSLVISTDSAQTSLVSGVTSTSSVSTGSGMLRGETVVSAGLNSATPYYVSMTVTSEGNTIACTPIYYVPAANTTTPVTQLPISSQNMWVGSPNPYGAGGAFDQTPAAPQMTSGSQSGAAILVGASLYSPGNWSSVQYSTDGGTTWASPTVVGSTAITPSVTSYRTTVKQPKIVTAMVVHGTTASVRQAPVTTTRTISVNIGQQSSGAAFGSGTYAIQLRGVNRSPDGSSTIYGTASTAYNVSYTPVVTGLAATGADASPLLPVGAVIGAAGLLAIAGAKKARRQRI